MKLWVSGRMGRPVTRNCLQLSRNYKLNFVGITPTTVGKWGYRQCLESVEFGAVGVLPQGFRYGIWRYFTGKHNFTGLVCVLKRHLGLNLFLGYLLRAQKDHDNSCNNLLEGPWSLVLWNFHASWGEKRSPNPTGSVLG